MINLQLDRAVTFDLILALDYRVADLEKIAKEMEFDYLEWEQPGIDMDRNERSWLIRNAKEARKLVIEQALNQGMKTENIFPLAFSHLTREEFAGV